MPSASNPNHTKQWVPWGVQAAVPPRSSVESSCVTHPFPAPSPTPAQPGQTRASLPPRTQPHPSGQLRKGWCPRQQLQPHHLQGHGPPLSPGIRVPARGAQETVVTGPQWLRSRCNLGSAGRDGLQGGCQGHHLRQDQGPAGTRRQALPGNRGVRLRTPASPRPCSVKPLQPVREAHAAREPGRPRRRPRGQVRQSAPRPLSAA